MAECESLRVLPPHDHNLLLRFMQTDSQSFHSYNTRNWTPLHCHLNSFMFQLYMRTLIYCFSNRKWVKSQYRFFLSDCKKKEIINININTHRKSVGTIRQDLNQPLSSSAEGNPGLVKTSLIAIKIQNKPIRYPWLLLALIFYWYSGILHNNILNIMVVIHLDIQ